jgi:hypothetical protein
MYVTYEIYHETCLVEEGSNLGYSTDNINNSSLK